MVPLAVNIVIFIEDEFTVIFSTLAISGQTSRRPNCESILGNGLYGLLHRHCWTAPRMHNPARFRPIAEIEIGMANKHSSLRPT
jgi:hypothetical protein